MAALSPVTSQIMGTFHVKGWADYLILTNPAVVFTEKTFVHFYPVFCPKTQKTRGKNAAGLQLYADLIA